MSERAKLRLILLSAICLLGTASTSLAGLPHWRRRLPEPAGPKTTYAPEMRHYVVIDPVPAGAPPPITKDALRTKVPAVGQIYWRQTVESIPTYPWGWFGARRGVQNMQHRRYYGGESDWLYLRGD